MWIVTETHKQQNLGIFTLNLSFPLAKRFPVLVLHTWIAIHVVFTAKVILPGSGTKPGQGHRGILVVGFWVFLHLALSEKLSKSSPQWIWVLLYFWRLSYIRNQVGWSLRLCWWIYVGGGAKSHWGPLTIRLQFPATILPLEIRNLRLSPRGGMWRENTFLPF